MGGFFGAVSKRDVVDVFFWRGLPLSSGHAPCGHGLLRGHGRLPEGDSLSIENTPFRSRFDKDLRALPRYERHRLHFRYRPPALARSRPPRHLCHHDGRCHHQCRRAHRAVFRAGWRAVYGHELRCGQSHRARRGTHQPERRPGRGHRFCAEGHSGIAHAARHDGGWRRVRCARPHGPLAGV